MALMHFYAIWMLTSATGWYAADNKIKRNILPEKNKAITRYNCVFDENVDCLWQTNNSFISINPYKYVEGDGTRTMDCSIFINGSSPSLGNIDCVGIVLKQPQVIQIGGTLKMTCHSNLQSEWKRNGELVDIIGGRYRHNCSTFTILRIEKIDLGRWECFDKHNTKFPIKSYCLRSQFYTSQDYINCTIHVEVINESLTEISSNLKNSTSLFEKTTITNLQSTNSTDAISSLGIANIAVVCVTILLVITIVALLIRNKIKRRRRQAETNVKLRQLYSLVTISDASVNSNLQATSTERNDDQTTDANGYLTPLSIMKKSNRNKRRRRMDATENTFEDHTYEKID